MKKTVLFVISFILLFTLFAGANDPATGREPSEYEILLFKYLLHIEKIAESRDLILEEKSRERHGFIETQIKNIEDNEKEIIRKIEEEIAKRPNKEMFKYESDYEYTLGNLFHGSSDASYRLTRHFIESGHLKNKEVVLKNVAMSSIPVLTPEWSALFEECLEAQSTGSFWWKIGVTFLYSHGPSPEKHLSALLDLLDKNYPPALAALLFDYQDDPYEPRPVVNAFAMSLYEKYSSADAYFTMRMVAAYYAMEIHDRETASQIFMDISQQDFIGVSADSGPVFREPDADIDLLQAKEAAQDMLFYEIKGPAAYKEIWKTAHQRRTDSLAGEKAGKENPDTEKAAARKKRIHKGNYPYYYSEEQHALALLKVLSSY